MFFISSGSVDVVSEDGKTIYTTLIDGNFFGELSLLLEQPRIASIRATGFTHLYTLDKKPFERVLLQYPDLKQQIDIIVEQRLKELEPNK